MRPPGRSTYHGLDGNALSAPAGLVDDGKSTTANLPAKFYITIINVNPAVVIFISLPPSSATRAFFDFTHLDVVQLFRRFLNQHTILRTKSDTQ